MGFAVNYIAVDQSQMWLPISCPKIIVQSRFMMFAISEPVLNRFRGVREHLGAAVKNVFKNSKSWSVSYQPNSCRMKCDLLSFLLLVLMGVSGEMVRDKYDSLVHKSPPFLSPSECKLS